MKYMFQHTSIFEMGSCHEWMNILFNVFPKEVPHWCKRLILEFKDISIALVQTFVMHLFAIKRNLSSTGNKTRLPSDTNELDVT